MDVIQDFSEQLLMFPSVITSGDRITNPKKKCNDNYKKSRRTQRENIDLGSLATAIKNNEKVLGSPSNAVY